MSTTASASTVDVSAEREVAAGIAWMNKHKPGWWITLNPDLILSGSGISIIRELASETGRFEDDGMKYRELGMFAPTRFRSPISQEAEAWYTDARRLWAAEITRRITRRQAAARQEGQES